MSNAPAVNTSDFEALVLGSEFPVLVDFWATCRAIGVAVEAIAGDYAERAKVFKLNLEEEPEIAGRYGVQSLPTLLIFKDGQQVAELVGPQNNRQTIEAALSEYI